MNWYKKSNKKQYGNIYVDLDGVLAWWEKGVNELCDGISWDDFPVEKGDPKRDLLQDFMDDNYDFWANLERTPQFNQIWNTIKDHDPTVLTSPHDVKDEDCRQGKIDWCKKNLDLESDKVIVNQNKYNWATDKDDNPNILIDDLDKNLDLWEEHGGIAIKVTKDNAEEVVSKLKKHLT